MKPIIKDGVVDITHHIDSRNNGGAKIKEEISKFRILDEDRIAKGSRIYETPKLAVSNKTINFETKKSNLDPKNAKTDLYTRSDTVYNDHVNLSRDRKTSIYINKRSDYKKVANDINLDNRNFYEDNSRFMGSLGNFNADKICPIRKSSFDNYGIKFLNSTIGFKHSDNKELISSTVPLMKNMNARHTPIYIMNNGTKSIKIIKNS